MFFKKQRDEEIYSHISKDKVIDGIVYTFLSDKYYRKSGKWYKFYSDRARISWNLNEGGNLNYMNSQEQAGTLGFRDGTLIQNAKDGRIYVISNAKKRLITAPLGDYGFDYSQVVEVSDAEAEFHLDGEDI